MSKPFSQITIIYNPHSTGNGQKLAERFAAKLTADLPKSKISLIATEYAGHAEKLGYDLARSSHRPLIISASGDGGYHEVINGLLLAQSTGANPVAGLLPAGNANDHYRNVHKADVTRRITIGETRQVDVIRLESRSHHKPFIRYAHSYIGVGLTPQIARELNKTTLNRFKESLIVLRALFSLKPVHLRIDGETHGYDSILVSNVPTISKYFSVYNQARVDDGKFEITIYRRRYRLKMLRYIVAASTVGLSGTTQATSFSFVTTEPTLLQLDGEVVRIDANATVRISLQPAALSCVI